jgi:hypothetical protein
MTMILIPAIINVDRRPTSFTQYYEDGTGGTELSVTVYTRDKSLARMYFEKVGRGAKLKAIDGPSDTLRWWQLPLVIGLMVLMFLALGMFLGVVLDAAGIYSTIHSDYLAYLIYLCAAIWVGGTVIGWIRIFLRSRKRRQIV